MITRQLHEDGRHQITNDQHLGTVRSHLQCSLVLGDPAQLWRSGRYCQEQFKSLTLQVMAILQQITDGGYRAIIVSRPWTQGSADPKQTDVGRLYLTPAFKESWCTIKWLTNFVFSDYHMSSVLVHCRSSPTLHAWKVWTTSSNISTTYLMLAPREFLLST